MKRGVRFQSRLRSLYNLWLNTPTPSTALATCTLHSFRLSTRGPGKVDLHAVLARCLGNTPGSTFLCCSISLQVYEAWETAEERQSLETAGRCQSPMTSEEWQWILQDSVTQAAKGSWREAGKTTWGPFPAVSVDSWRLGEAWETLSALLAASSKSKWCVGVNRDWIPPCSRESHPRSAMPTFSSPPPMHQLNFHWTFTVPPILVTINCAAPASSLSPSTHTPPPPSRESMCLLCVLSWWSCASVFKGQESRHLSVWNLCLCHSL